MRSTEGEEKQTRTIRGRAIVFNTPTVLYKEEDYEVREVIATEAVPESLLKESDIIMTMHHNPERVLARSKQGKGTLKYSLTKEGVDFEFDAPQNADGDAAIESVSRGDIDGCSFWAYLREEMMERSVTREGNKKIVTITVKGFETIRDFTLTPTPQYTETEVEAIRSMAQYGEKPEAVVDTDAIDAIERESNKFNL